MNKQILPEKISDLEPKQKSWLTLAGMKAECEAAMQGAELSIQSLLKDHSKATDLQVLQGVIKEAKAKAADAKARRLHFTNLVTEKIISPMLEPEKRNDALISAASESELTEY